MNWTLINSQAMDCPAKMMLVHTSIIFDSGFLNFRLHVQKNNLLGVGRYKIQQLFSRMPYCQLYPSCATGSTPSSTVESWTCLSKRRSSPQLWLGRSPWALVNTTYFLFLSFLNTNFICCNLLRCFCKTGFQLRCKL